jgi:hypothetical protein
MHAWAKFNIIICPKSLENEPNDSENEILGGCSEEENF